MPRYSEERKASVLSKLQPPHNETVAEISRREGISEATLYNWRTQLRDDGVPVPGKTKDSESWSSQARLAVVIETATLTEEQLGAYCREKGLYVEQVRQWKADFVEAGDQTEQSRQQSRRALREATKQNKKLEKELRRKDKALAEAAALLVLQKKFNTLLEEDEDN